jgi:hypothetical protein
VRSSNNALRQDADGGKIYRNLAIRHARDALNSYLDFINLFIGRFSAVYYDDGSDNNQLIHLNLRVDMD